MHKNTLLGGGGEATFKTLSETSEKIVECTINPFISFIEKQGLKGEGGTLSPGGSNRRYQNMSSSRPKNTTYLAGRQQNKSVRLSV